MITSEMSLLPPRAPFAGPVATRRSDGSGKNGEPDNPFEVRGLRVGGDDVADLGVAAVGWVELVAAADQDFELCFEGVELPLSCLDVAQLGGEQGADVGAGCGAVVA